MCFTTNDIFTRKNIVLNGQKLYITLYVINSFIVANVVNEKHNCWINIYSFIIESLSSLTSCTGKRKTQTL